MLLYHGTSEWNYKDIVKEGVIDNFFYSNDTTDLINDCLNDYGSEDSLRNGAIFLFSDIEHASAYDYVFEVNVKDLNVNLLYVADFRISTDILDSFMRGNDEDIERLVKEYEKRFITYKEYMEEENNNIIIPEFLYFGKIQLEVTKTIDIIDELFLEYEEKEQSGC